MDELLGTRGLAGALVALRVTVYSGGAGRAVLCPRPLFSLRLSSSAARRTIFLDEAKHFLHNRVASPAKLRWCFRFIPEIAVRFAPKWRECGIGELEDSSGLTSW